MSAIEVSPHDPIGLAVLNWHAADRKAITLATVESTAPATPEYMQACNERAEAARELIERLQHQARVQFPMPEAAR